MKAITEQKSKDCAPCVTIEISLSASSNLLFLVKTFGLKRISRRKENGCCEPR